MRRAFRILPFLVLAAGSAGQAAVDDLSYETSAVSQSFAAIYAPAGSDLALGQAALAAGDYPRAVRLLEPLADGSRNSQIKLLAGYANLGAGRIGKAERHFGAALKLSYDAPFAHLGLGLAAVARGDRAEAAVRLERIEQARERCAQTCSRAAQLDQAAGSLRRALS